MIYNRRELIKILKQSGLALTKQRGQNYLLDSAVLEKMASFLKPGDNVLEIGPGMGHLSRYLALKTEKLTCVEIDRGVVKWLLENPIPHANVLHQDFLKYEFKAEPDKCIVYGNIPYSLTSEMVLKLLKNIEKISEFYLLMQKEAGERLSARPGQPNYGRLSVLSQHYTEIETLFRVPRQSFFPEPTVDSVFIRFKAREYSYDEGFAGFVTLLFTQRRKSLEHVLRRAFPGENVSEILSNLGIAGKERAENLTPEILIRLFSGLK